MSDAQSADTVRAIRAIKALIERLRGGDAQDV